MIKSNKKIQFSPVIVNVVSDSIDFQPPHVSYPISWLGHAPFMNWLFKTIKPKLFVELGVHSGNSFFSACQSVVDNKLKTKCFGVDSWEGDPHSGSYENKIYDVVENFNKKYKSFSTLLKMRFDEASSKIKNQSIDILHIDGFHSYDAVSHDYHTWLPKMKSDGIILFHDISIYDNEFGVHILWEELKKDKEKFCYEFNHSNGLGVLFLNRESGKKIFNSFTKNDSILFKKIFERLGDILIYKFQADFNMHHLKLLENNYRALEKRNKIIEKQNNNINLKNRSLDNKYNNVQTILNGVVSSFSWKITKPLRSARSSFPRFFNFLYKLNKALSLTFSIFKYSYSLKNTYTRLKLLFNQLVIRRLLLKKNNEYQAWIKKYDTFSMLDDKLIKNKIKKFQYTPKISIILPIYKSNYLWLKQSIESVCSQLYENWELCIADDFSNDPRLARLIKRFSQDNPKIKVVFRETNGHISEASNSAIEIATGDYLTFLDHDDLLRPQSLYWVVKTLNQHKTKNLKLIYSDEDKIDAKSLRFNPYFKTDWNRELFYKHNFICHLAVYDKTLVKKIGGLRKGYEGAQDYDLILRYIEQINDNQIFHIPKILYHWRYHNNSTSKNINSKNYAIDNGNKALSEHFKKRGMDVKNSFDYSKSIYFQKYSLPNKKPLVSIIIPTKNKYELIRNCINSILQKTDYENYEIIIINNNSDDQKTLKFLNDLIKKYSNIRLINDYSDFNYSKLNNDAIKTAKGEYICLMNNDIEIVSKNWLSEMMSYALQSDIGAVGTKLLFPDNTVQHAGVILGIGGIAGHAHKGLESSEPGYFSRAIANSEFSCVTAACLVIAKMKYNLVGGLNEHNLKVAFNDVDFCLKLKDAGYRNICVQNLIIYHHESQSRGYENTFSKIRRFKKECTYISKTWANVIKNDYAYNPNLTIDSENFGLAWPPRVKKL